MRVGRSVERRAGLAGRRAVDRGVDSSSFRMPIGLGFSSWGGAASSIPPPVASEKSSCEATARLRRSQLPRRDGTAVGCRRPLSGAKPTSRKITRSFRRSESMILATELSGRPPVARPNQICCGAIPHPVPGGHCGGHEGDQGMRYPVPGPPNKGKIRPCCGHRIAHRTLCDRFLHRQAPVGATSANPPARNASTNNR